MAETRRVLAADAYAAEVEADIGEAHAIGVNGVPFFVIDRRYGISGAQPAELFLQALTQARGRGRGDARRLSAPPARRPCSQRTQPRHSGHGPDLSRVRRRRRPRGQALPRVRDAPRPAAAPSREVRKTVTVLFADVTGSPPWASSWTRKRCGHS